MMMMNPIRTVPEDCIQFAFVVGSPMKCTLILENASERPQHLIVPT